MGAAELDRFDMHIHLDHVADAAGLAGAAEARGIGMLCTTVTPDEGIETRERFATLLNVRVGVGMHPWWVADGRLSASDIAHGVALASQARFVGEVGLDRSGAHASGYARQLEAFEWTVRACAEHPVAGRVLSIHAVRAAGDALDVLERYDLPSQAACVFHWFSGTSDELVRARRLGCYVSVNERMLSSKRGRAYAAAVPASRLLLETDAPPVFDGFYTVRELEESLGNVLAGIAAARGCDKKGLAARIEQTSRELLGF